MKSSTLHFVELLLLTLFVSALSLPQKSDGNLKRANYRLLTGSAPASTHNIAITAASQAKNKVSPETKQKNQPSKSKHKKHPHKPNHKKHPAHKYPFKRVVAFGDNLSDNGNGSYAHGVAAIGQPHNTIYGYRTWTDGPVAVSYLVTMLGVPLSIDYAFGHAQGGSRIGATILDSYTYSKYAPDGFTQVRNYTHTSGYSRDEVANTLHFVWIGNNDINLLHLSTAIWNNTEFGVQMARLMTELIGNLVDFGAEHIFVPGLYAKHLSPSWHFYASNLTERMLLGHAIKQANTHIQAELHKHYGSKVTFYDVFGFMEHIWNHYEHYGIKDRGTDEKPSFCDGQSQENWDKCVTHHHGNWFYWMQFLDMTTTIHKLIAEDMHRALRKRFLG